MSSVTLVLVSKRFFLILVPGYDRTKRKGAKTEKSVFAPFLFVLSYPGTSVKKKLSVFALFNSPRRVSRGFNMYNGHTGQKFRR